jgi:hypothetical protein
MERLTGNINYNPERLVSWVQRTTDQKIDADQESQYSYWQRKLAEVRGNGFNAEQLKAILSLKRAPLLGSDGKPMDNPFLQEILDLAMELYSAKQIFKDGKLSPEKMDYLNYSNASLFFLRRGSLTYPQSEVCNLDLSSTQNVVTETCSQLYLAKPPYQEFVGELNDQVLNGICKKQLGISIRMNGMQIN